MQLRIRGVLLAAAGLACASAPVAASPTACGRACLRRTLDGYMAAVLAHQPAQAPLASSYRATENAVETPAGEGLWSTATGLGPVQRRYLDPVSGQAAYYGTLLEGGTTDVVSLRVKVDAGRVAEAEWTVARPQYGGMFSSETLIATPPPPDTPLPPAERTSRAALIAVADAYFQGVQDHDGAAVQKIDGCDRFENGFRVTNRTGPPPGPPPEPPPQAGPPPPGGAQELRSGDCTAGFDHFARTIAETSHRRYPVVDEEAGVVLGNALFHRPPGVTMKRNLLSEYFWLKRGRISTIYAAMYYMDPSAPDTPGW